MIDIYIQKAFNINKKSINFIKIILIVNIIFIVTIFPIYFKILVIMRKYYFGDFL